MSLLNKDQILEAADVKSKIVDVPGWGGKVKVATMTGKARDQFEVMIAASGPNSTVDNIRAIFASCVIVDEKGELLFTKKDIDKLALKSFESLDIVLKAAHELNLITNKDIESAAKNS